MYICPILQRGYFEKWSAARPAQTIKTLMDMPLPNNKRELQTFLGIINYLGKYLIPFES